MKNFNEWLSIRSNSYNETEGDGESGFDFGNIPGSKNPSSVIRAGNRYSGALERAGGSKKIINKRQDLAEKIISIYQVDDPSKIGTQINRIKSDLRYLINHLTQTNSLDNIPKDEDDDDHDHEETDHMDMDAEKDNRTNIETY